MLKQDSLPADAWHFGMRLRVLVDSDTTAGNLAICQVHAPPGSRTAVHRHEREDEVVHVVDGAVEVWRQGTSVTVPTGGSLLLPRGIPHRISAAHGGAAELLCAFLPGGVERSLLAASATDAATVVDPDDVAALLSGAGVSVYDWQIVDATATATVAADAPTTEQPQPEPA